LETHVDAEAAPARAFELCLRGLDGIGKVEHEGQGHDHLGIDVQFRDAAIAVFGNGPGQGLIGAVGPRLSVDEVLEAAE